MGLTPDQAKQKINDLYARLRPRADEAREFKDFYEGRQPLAYASDQWSEYHQNQYKDFSDNWCEVVANSSTERIGVIGFTLPGAKRAQKALWDAWLSNEQDSLSSQGFLEAAIARRSFAHVWGDRRGDPIITWRSAEQAIVEYDAETARQRLFGLNIWSDVDEGFEYGTLTTPLEVWRFRRQGVYKASSLVRPDGEPIAGIGGWELIDPQPAVNHLGMVPLVEFPNRPVLGRGPLSDIQGTVAMQNAINLLWAYLFNAADFASMPARVVMGQQPPKLPILDDNGQEIGKQTVDERKLTEGRLLWLTGQNTKIGQWDPAKLDVFTQVIEQAVGHIAAQTRTPPHYLVANKGLSQLSGDALTAAEAGLVEKVMQAREFFEPRMRDLFQLIALQLGLDKAAKAARLGKVIWKRPQERSESQTADAMVKDAKAGYPFEYLLEKYGTSPTDVDRIMKMKRRESDMMLSVGVDAAAQELGQESEDVSAE